MITSKELIAYVELASTHQEILGGYDGNYTLGITYKPLAILLRVETDNPDQFPKKVLVNGNEIPIVIENGFKPLKSISSLRYKPKVHLRIIGDVHGCIRDYIKLAEQADYGIQVGDLGFNYDLLEESDLDPNKYRVIGGNHDNYNELDGKFIDQTEHFLGDYGIHTVPDVGDFFYVRGGNSIDKEYRKEGVTWWAKEEISYADAVRALEKYKEIKPDFVLSHECPVNIIDELAGFKTWNGKPIVPSMTANLLQQMLESHRPKLWIFGHHHKDYDRTIDGTRFICIPELSCVDIPKRNADEALPDFLARIEKKIFMEDFE